MHMTPRTALRWSVRSLYVSGPLALLTLLAWGFRWLPGTRPQLVLMVYLLVLLLSVGAACVACLAGCHLAIHNAFKAGMETGQASMRPRPRDPVHRQQRRRRNGHRDPLLELVD